MCGVSLTLDRVEPVYRWSALRSARSLWRLGTLGVSWAEGTSGPYVCAVEVDSTLIHRAARLGDCTALITTCFFSPPHGPGCGADRGRASPYAGERCRRRTATCSSRANCQSSAATSSRARASRSKSTSQPSNRVTWSSLARAVASWYV
jgi:hypothetical protein